MEDPEDRDKDIRSHRTHRPTQVTKLNSHNRSEHQRNMDLEQEGGQDLNNRRCLAMQRQLQGRIINQIRKLAPGNRKTRRRRQRPKTAAKRDDVTIGIGREAVVEVAVATSDAADVATLAAVGVALITAEIIHEVVADIVETAAEEAGWIEATGWIDKIEWIGIIGGIGRGVTETEDLDHVVEVVAMESAEDVAEDEEGQETKHQQPPCTTRPDTNVSAALQCQPLQPIDHYLSICV